MVFIEFSKVQQLDKLPFDSMERLKRWHLSFRHKLTKPILKVQSVAAFSFGKFLRERGFFEIRPPIISTLTDPGIRGARAATIDFYGKPYKLTTSMIMHKQMALTAIERVFSFSPNIRLEPVESAGTGRHLAEFTQLDLEAAHFSRDKITELAEELVCRAISDIKRECAGELAALGRKLVKPKRPFKRITHSRALEFLRSEGLAGEADKELLWEHEKFLSEKLGGFFWVFDYPPKSRGFYDRLGDNGKLVDFDLIYPEGFGEAISGSERVHTPEQALSRMAETGLDPGRFGWYFELLEAGVPPSAGFGLGFERFVRFACGLGHVWQAASFPRVPGVHSP